MPEKDTTKLFLSIQKIYSRLQNKQFFVFGGYP